MAEKNRKPASYLSGAYGTLVLRCSPWAWMHRKVKADAGALAAWLAALLCKSKLVRSAVDGIPPHGEVAPCPSACPTLLPSCVAVESIWDRDDADAPSHLHRRLVLAALTSDLGSYQWMTCAALLARLAKSLTICSDNFSNVMSLTRSPPAA